MKLTFTLTFDFDHEPGQLWPFLTDTERLNRLSGYSSVNYEEFANDFGGSTRYGNGYTGPLKHRYLEHDFEWEEPRYTSVELDFAKGPLKHLYREIRLEPVGPKGTHMVWNIELQVRNIFEALANMVFFKLINFPKIRAICQEINKKQEPRVQFSFGQLKLEPQSSREAKIPLTETKLGDDLKSVVDAVHQTAPHELSHIRPYRLGKKIGLDKKKSLIAFVKGAKEGLFDIQWDLLCPSCRSPKASYKTLSDLGTEAHCPACNISFTADFDQALELTFRPSPRLRVVDDTDYCIGNPMRTPHIRSQRRVGAHRSITQSLENLNDSSFRLYSPQVKAFAPLEKGFDYHFRAENKSWVEVKKVESKNPSLLIENTHDFEILVRVEKAEWLEDIVTAKDVANLQEFRQAFATEALRPGTELVVKNLTVLFTDLRGSTKFYNRVGDGLAFGLVRDHFDVLMKIVGDCNGAIVKTIGDAIMASFNDPLDATRAALAMHDGIHGLNQKAQAKVDSEIVIKIGIHAGPVLAVNLNDRLDYFGATVNLAARTEGQCQGGDVVITKEIMSAPGVIDFLKTKELKVTRFKKEIKGFEEQSEGIELFRIARPI